MIGRLLAALLALVALAAQACTGGASSRGASSITVFAPASLTEAFTELGEEYEAAHPGSTVTFEFASSATLQRQLADGAPADVFAAADETSMTAARDAGSIGEKPVPFAGNRLAIVTAPGNPEGIETLADLARPSLQVVLCGEPAPCGRYTQEVLTSAGVSVPPASLEENVKGVLTKVRLGEADAGIVYVTDVAAGGDDVTGVEIPDDDNVIADYLIAPTADSGKPDGATAFIALVLSEEGRSVLERAGFLPPS